VTLRVLIADDEEVARRRLVRLLAMIPETELADSQRGRNTRRFRGS